MTCLAKFPLYYFQHYLIVVINIVSCKSLRAQPVPLTFTVVRQSICIHIKITVRIHSMQTLTLYLVFCGIYKFGSNIFKISLTVYRINNSLYSFRTEYNLLNTKTNSLQT